jgi:2-methylisocitrate lyase-like PEP mutase family enzyme
MFAAVARVARAVSVPVTADLEAGYGLPAADLVGRLLEAGAVGCNLEDSDHRAGGLVDLERQADRLAAVRAAADAAGVPIVINARVDVHLRQVGPAEGRLDVALARARRYLEAGADCVYPILVADEVILRGFVEGSGGPVNALARPGAPSLQRLAELGVARISFGGGLWRRAHQTTEALAAAIGAGRDPELAEDD